MDAHPHVNSDESASIVVTATKEEWEAIVTWESYVTMEELRRKLRELGVNV